MKHLISPLLLSILCWIMTDNLHADGEEQLPKGLQGVSIGGLWYLSYQNGTAAGSDYNSFKVKRACLNVKKKFNAWFSGRITPDAEQDGSGDLKVRLKYAYADFKLPQIGFLVQPHVEWGLAHRTWLDFEENLNYYRLQDTMFLERNGLFNSADLGFTFFALLGGQMDDNYKKRVNDKYPGRYGSVAFGVYNGGGYHAKELNTKKEPEVRLTLRPLPEVLPGLQFSYFGVFAHGNTAEAPTWNIHTGFISLEDARLVVTGTYYVGKGNQNGEVDAGGRPKEKTGYSVFGELKIPEKKLSLIGRYDWFDFDTNLKNDEVTRLILGLAIHLTGHSQILLDYDVAGYSQPGNKNDLRFQVTTEVHF